MIRIYLSRSGEVAVVGTASELNNVADQFKAILDAFITSISVSGDVSGSPMPYERLLKEMIVTKEDGPIHISVSADSLLISGSKENLSHFSKYFAFDAGASIGKHHHPRYFSDSAEYMSPSATPLTIEVR